jgi:hypothetical protein
MPRNDQGLVAAIAEDLAQLVFERCERDRFPRSVGLTMALTSTG